METYDRQKVEWARRRRDMQKLWAKGHSFAAIGRLYRISRQQARSLVLADGNGK